MNDIATLGLAVDSRPVATATTTLDRFTQSSGRAEASTQRLGATAKTAGGFLMAMTTQLVAGIASAQTIMAIRRVTDEVAKIGEVAKRVGVTAREIQVLRFAVDQSGGSAQSADQAYQNFGRAVGEASAKSGALYHFLRANGVEITSQRQAWDAFLDLLSRAGSESDKLAIASKVLGRTVGVDVVNALSKGKEGLREAGVEAERLGAIFSDDLIKRSQELDKEFKKLEISASAGLKRIAIEVAPFLIKELQSILNLAKDISYTFQLIKDGRIGEAIGQIKVGGFDLGATPEQLARRALATGGGAAMQGADFSAFDKLLGNTGGTKITVGKPPVMNFGKDQAARANEFDRVTKSIEKQIEAMKIEAHTFGMTEDAAARYRIEQELINAANRAGIPITGEVSANIAKLSDAYGAMTKQLETLRERQEMLDFGRDTVKGIASDLMRGVSAAEAFSNALNRIASKLMDMAIDNLFKNAFGGGNIFSMFGGGGFSNYGSQSIGVSGITSGFHGGGVVGGRSTFSRFVHPAYFDNAPRFHGGGIAGDEVPVIAKKGEGIFTPEQMRAMGGVSISVPVTISADGADPAQLSRLTGEVQKMQRELPSRVVSAVRKARNGLEKGI